MSKERAKRYAAVAAKGPELSRSCHIKVDVAADTQEKQEGRNGVDASARIWERLLHHPEVGESRRIVQGVIDICNGEQESDKHDKSEKGVDRETVPYSFWDSQAGIAHFL